MAAPVAIVVRRLLIAQRRRATAHLECVQILAEACRLRGMAPGCVAYIERRFDAVLYELAYGTSDAAECGAAGIGPLAPEVEQRLTLISHLAGAWCEVWQSTRHGDIA